MSRVIAKSFLGLAKYFKVSKKNSHMVTLNGHTWSHMGVVINCGGSVRRAGRVRRALRFLLMKTNDWG